MGMLDEYKTELRQKGSLVLNIKVRTGARTSALKGELAYGAVKIDLAAIPEKGKANDELIGFLAAEFEINRKNIKIIKGRQNRRKTVKLLIK